MSNLLLSNKERKYEILNKLGEGAFGSVYKVRCLDDGESYVFKFFSESKSPDIQKVHKRIQKNVESLIDKPITKAFGQKIEGLVLPIDMVTNVTNKPGFGYVTEYVNVSQCGTVFKSWKNYEAYRPDAKQICEICKKFAEILDEIHKSGRGLCEINEGNIYFDLQNNQVYVMECENILCERPSETFVTSSPYTAPETIGKLSLSPDTDRYSMAVYFYRLMVGGYPYEGKKSIRYVMDNGLDGTNVEHAEKIYDNAPLFAFDENDDSNSIVNVTDSKIPDNLKEQWKVQAEFWKRLPESMKATFQKAFEDKRNPNAEKRPTETEWIKVFNNVLENGIVKCECGKHNYLGNETCLFCGKKLK